MFDELKFRYRLRQLQRQSLSIDNLYIKKVTEARREKKDRDEIEAIVSDRQFESQLIQDDIAQLATQYLYRTAYKYLLPKPGLDEEGMWEESRITGLRLLTDKGISELRSAIRKERKERSEHFWMWLAGLTGLVGALTGFLALLGK